MVVNMIQYCQKIFYRSLGNKIDSLSFIVSTILGTFLGIIILDLSPEFPQWSNYRWTLLLVSIIGYLGFLLIGDLKRMLIITLALTIPINLSFDPFGDVVFHPGGAAAGITIYLYDFSLIGLLFISLLDVLSKRRSIEFSIIDLGAILFIFWSILSVINSFFIKLSFYEILRLIKLYLLARVIALNITEKREILDIFLALVVGLMIQGTVGIIQYFFDIDMGLGGFVVGDLRRVSAIVGWPNTLGAYAATILSIVLPLWFLNVKRYKVLIRVACLIGVLLLILSFSRGAWISLLAGLVISVFLCWWFKCFDIKMFARLTTIGLSVIAISVIFSKSIVPRLMEINPNMAVISDRMKLNQIALNMINDHPLFGIGLNTFREMMRQYDTTGVSYFLFEPVHNVFLLIGAEIGLVGLSLFLFLILSAFSRGIKAIQLDDRFLSAFSIGISSSFVVLTVNNLADNHLRTEVLYALFWFLIGLVIALDQMRRCVNHC